MNRRILQTLTRVEIRTETPLNFVWQTSPQLEWRAVWREKGFPGIRRYSIDSELISARTMETIFASTSCLGAHV